MSLPPPFYLERHAVLGSTNAEAKARALDGAPSGLVVLADQQTQGRGRSGRSWTSEPGNLYASVVLRPEKTLENAALYSFVAGLSLHDAIVEALGPGPLVQCKWPNDVLVDGKKVSGLLLESAGVSRPEDIVDWLVIGFGINIQSHPEETLWPAADLIELGAQADTTPLGGLSGFCTAFNKWSQALEDVGFSAIRHAWVDRAWGLGTNIRVRTATEELEGRFESLDETGALVLLSGSETRHITAGDVFFD